MPWFRRRPLTPLPEEPLGPEGHEAAVLTEASSLPEFPGVVVDLLDGRVAADRVALQVALETAPALADALKTAWRVGPLDRLLDIMPAEIVFERLIELACLRFDEQLAAPACRERRRRRWKHSVAVAGAARALTRDAGGTSVEAQQAFVAGALHLIGVHAFDEYARTRWPQEADRLSRSDSGISGCAESVGCCHWRVGGALLKARGLPEPVWQAVARQGRRGGGTAAGRLRQARRCAHLAGFPPVTGDAPTQPAPVIGIQAAGEAVRHMMRLQESRLV